MKIEKVRPHLLGRAPIHVESKDLIDYFIYVFEFSLRREVGSVEKVRHMISSRVKEVIPNYEQLSTSKQWWGLILIVQEQLMKDQRGYFASEVATNLLTRIDEIDESTLRLRLNDFQYGISGEMEGQLLIRPCALKELGVSLDKEEDWEICFLLEKEEALIKIFKKHLVQKDINKLHLEEILSFDRSLWHPFSHFWQVYFETFTSYTLGIFETTITSPHHKNKEEVALIGHMDNLIHLFFLGSVIHPDKMDLLHEEVIQEIKPLLDRLGKERNHFWEEMNVESGG